jgi:hypothetical protein
MLAVTAVPPTDYYQSPMPLVDGPAMNPSFASDDFGRTAGLAVLVFAVLFFLFVLAAYLFFSYCLFRIAKKANIEDAWMSWVPILNLIVMIKLGQKPVWWVILFFVPVVGMIIGIVIWMNIFYRFGKPEWMGLLMIIPVVNLVMLVYLAFSQDMVIVNSAPQFATAPAGAPTSPMDPAPISTAPITAPKNLKTSKPPTV